MIAYASTSTEFWTGVTTSTYSIIQDNWDFIFVLFGLFFVLFTIRGFIWAIGKIKHIA